MSDGWVRIHRKLMNNPIFSSERGLKVWIWCLLRASHSGEEFYVGRKKVRLEPGQFVFGREKASGQLEMALSTVRNWMRVLRQDSYLDIKPTNKYSVVTILNWNEYQSSGQQNRQQIAHRLPTDCPQMDTYKNDKNDNNEKKGVSGTLSLTSRQRERLKIQYPHVDFEKTEAKFKAWQKSNGRRFANTLEAFRVWLIEDNSKNKPREAVII